MDCPTSDASDWSEADQGYKKLIRVKHYLCICCSCPQLKMIPTDISRIPGATSPEERSATHLIQAFATYDVVAGYCIDLISTTRDCLRLWKGDEVKASSVFVSLVGEISKIDIFSLDSVYTTSDRMVLSCLTGVLCTDF